MILNEVDLLYNNLFFKYKPGIRKEESNSGSQLIAGGL
jgi:hypothetical protein